MTKGPDAPPSPPPAHTNIRDQQLAAVQRWRGLIDTQMHFNDMLMRTRTVSLSIVMAVFGAAAVALAQFPDRLTTIPGSTVHVSAVVMAFGLLLLVSIFVLDYFYYYRLLLAVVRLTEEVEAASRDPLAPIELWLTSRLSECVSARRASLVIFAFYGIPFGSGLLFMLYLMML